MGCCNSRVSIRNLQLIDYTFLSNETIGTFDHNIKNNYEYYNSVVNSIDNSGMKYLSYICLNASHLLKYLIENKIIERCDMEHTDYRGRTFLHYLFMNIHTDVKDIRNLFNYSTFKSIKNEIVQTTDDEGNTFFHIAAINKNYGFLSYINIDNLPILDTVNNENNTLFSMAIMDNQHQLVKFFIKHKWKNTNLLSAPYPYANILALLLHFNEDDAIFFMKKKKKFMKYILDDYYKLTIDDDYTYSLVSLICHLQKVDFLLQFIKTGYITPDDLIQNFHYICKYLRPNIIHDLLKVPEINAHELVNQVDHNGNNILQMAIIEKPNLVKTLVKNKYVTNTTLTHKNKIGNNSFMTACKHNFSFAQDMYHNFNDINGFMFTKNIIGSDFIDILINREKQDSYPYLTCLIDDDIYDNHNNIMNKFQTMNKLSTDEIIYIRNLEMHNNPIIDDSATTFDDECTVCMEKYTSVLLNCGHRFCLKCIVNDTECHICRQKIFNRRFNPQTDWINNPSIIN